MEFTVRKKILISSLIIVVFVVLVGVVLWYKNPSQLEKVGIYSEYSGLNMRQDWDVADDIVYGAQNTIFAEQIKQVGYDTFLHGTGPYTVFLPTDQAYSNLPSQDQDLLRNNQGSLRQILLYNIVKGRYRFSDLHDGMKLHTIQGDDITVSKKGDAIVLDGYAYIQTYDIESKNGIIHMTTNYLIPPSMAR